MARFTVNSERFDPYHNFKFKIKWDGEYVAGLSKCSALKKTTEVTTWYEANDQSTPHKIPGKTTFDPITLSGGVTHDTAFEDWANKVNNFAGEAAMSLKSFRKDITLEVCNLQGATVLAYNVFRCWVSEYTALPELDAAGNAVMIQTLKLENEGWQRDTQITEPAES
ncbi:phage tail-like protein [Kibdelosporangium banguiense]|uniref:Phage tail-like protein n=1 Tax=Kibdelosporangium banguiense TaxID=1365924 RepID=A0ABS4TQ61_9PSEU|nr:phage tail protein [Kibdelosporangium banguiense]MBP2326547.1 phage tail-like protein [Kibdelosporangium banguiense]